MINIYLLIALVLLVEHKYETDASEWNYGDQKHWSSSCLEGKKQSPINLKSTISKNIKYPPLVLKGYEENVAVVVKNNGHTVEVRPVQEATKREISGAGLPKVYQLDHFHLHWSSEHVMDDKRFPMEIHMVHYGAEYADMSNAIRHANGVAVLGILFHTSEEDNADFKPLFELIETVQNSVNEGSNLDNLKLITFLPKNLTTFYRYDGSLTTPDCNEVVVWTVFTETISISKNQIAVLKTRQTARNAPLTKNNRLVQPLNDRILYLHSISGKSGAPRRSAFLPLKSLTVFLMVVFRFFSKV